MKLRIAADGEGSHIIQRYSFFVWRDASLYDCGDIGWDQEYTSSCIIKYSTLTEAVTRIQEYYAYLEKTKRKEVRIPIEINDLEHAICYDELKKKDKTKTS